MTRAAAFTQGDVARLAKGLRQAGFHAVRFEIRPTGEIIAEGRESDHNAPSERTGWDEQLDAETGEPA